MDRPGLVDWLIAPLTWLERAKGPKRVGLVVLYLMTILVVGMLGWRTFSLWGLPAIGEPFDLAKYGTVEVRDSDNAMVLYREAAKSLIIPSSDYKVASPRAWGQTVWSLADPEVRRWVVDSRPGLAIWLEGTERPDALLAQPRDLSDAIGGLPLNSLQTFAQLASLEASALEEAGDLEGAWRFHRASLRASRHAGMHGGSSSRQIGLRLLNRLRGGLRSWTDDPRITPGLIHQAIADLDACQSMTAPISETVRQDYYAVRAVLDHPDEIRKFLPNGSRDDGNLITNNPFVPELRGFLMREPERSRRVLDLVTSGRLAQCDRPRSARPPLASPQFSIYEIDDKTPPSVAAINPTELVTWANRSAFAHIWGGQFGAAAWIDSEAGTFDSLRLRMAERGYEIEHGQPPTTYADLLGPYLKTLPEGFAPADRVSAEPAP